MPQPYRPPVARSARSVEIPLDTLQTLVKDLTELDKLLRKIRKVGLDEAGLKELVGFELHHWPAAQQVVVVAGRAKPSSKEKK